MRQKIIRNGFMSEKVCRALNYFEHFLVFVSVSVFASIVGVPVAIACSAVGLKLCAISARNKNYNSITNKKRKSKIK